MNMTYLHVKHINMNISQRQLYSIQTRKNRFVSCEILPILVGGKVKTDRFWAPFLCGVKAQIVRAHLSHLFKWRGVRLGQKRVCSFCEKYSSKREREEEKKSLCDFRTSTEHRFSDYNFRFVHRWIGLIFGQQVRQT